MGQTSSNPSPTPTATVYKNENVRRFPSIYMKRDSVSASAMQSVLVGENRKCADCGDQPTHWASTGFGIVICIECAGYHRSLGAHITHVKSLGMDGWTEQEMNYMDYGGNSKFSEYIQSLSLKDEEKSIVLKYTIPAVIYYREILAARIEDRDPLPIDQTDSKNLSEELIKANITKVSISNKTNLPPVWTPDNDTKKCMRCDKDFSVFVRRHHCRRCGNCVCYDCAPKNNTRPIIEWGMKEPVRHCRACYESPAVDWTPAQCECGC
mmetsp:Transcript_34598/g.35278  ORF Transcript_34598/g.35278 Transcript_34598/m.35278 type:complete len:266 (-) Transcript_34598:212-1009(-)